MRSSFRSRIFWTAMGFALGYGFALTEAALNLWPFEDDVTLVWIRWLGKQSIKFTFIAVLIVVVVQLLNIAIGVVRESLNKQQDS